MTDAQALGVLFSMAGSGGMAYFAGWGAGKAIKIVAKIAAVVLGAFSMAVFWMQSQGFLSINWNEIEEATSQAALAINGPVITDQLTNNSGVISLISDNLGIPMATSIGVGFMMGFLKGVKG